MNIHYLQYIHMFGDFEISFWKMSHQGYLFDQKYRKTVILRDIIIV